MRLPRQPAAVIFDMDGLLFDTERLHQHAIQAAAAAQGRSLPVSLFHRLLGHPWPTNHALLLAEYGDAAAVEALRQDWMHRFDALVGAGPPLKPGVLPLLDALDELGLPRAIATSGSHPEVARNTAAHGLGARFHAVVARGDYAAGKPAPDPYLVAAARLGVPPRDCLALEDSHNGIRSAAAAGMMAVMVPDLLPPTEDITALCVGVAGDLHEIRQSLFDGATRSAC